MAPHKRKLSSSCVHIWNVSTLISEKQELAYLKLLSEDEKAKASSFRFTKDRRIYITSRGVLRSLSGQYLKQLPEDIVFDYEVHGKPQFRVDTMVRFNVSHSENYVVIGFVHESEIGIDVEYLKKNFDVLELGQNFFSNDEIDTLEAMAAKDQYDGFYRCWTRKEAFIKAKGMGLSFPLDAFSVSLDNNTTALLEKTAWNPIESREWDMFSFSPGKGYIAAVAIKGNIKSVSIANWEHNSPN